MYVPMRFMIYEPNEPNPEIAVVVATDGDPTADDGDPTAASSCRACPEQGRRDGWTPFARRLFLEVLSETGRVTQACEYCRLSAQSAYALRARDPVFAASWDAACELARAPLADALYERAISGITDTIRKDGEVVAERHRFDSRLSVAVLHRLDKRCDRAAELGSHHLTLAAHWEEWLKLVGTGEDEAAGRALIQTAPDYQLHQLPLGPNPIGDDDSDADEPRTIDLSDRFWRDKIDNNVWLTDFPPPPGFAGYQQGEWGDYDYERACSADEVAILERDEARIRESERAEEEALRDSWLALLAGEDDDVEEENEDEEDDDSPSS